jgi:hypothetical protein
MLSSVHPSISGFLWVMGVIFLFVFALPMLFFPVKWASAFGWRIPDERPLMMYFSRCTGGLALALVVAVLRAAPQPEHHAPLFELLVAVSAIMTGVHLWGAVEKSQPPLETWEIGLYGALTGIFVWIRLVVGA